jgi:hypothetical protein
MMIRARSIGLDLIEVPIGVIVLCAPLFKRLR